MTAEYRIDIRNTAGTMVGQITDYLALSYSKQLNAPGGLAFQILPGSAYLSAISPRYIVEVYRRNVAAGVSWYRDFHGFILGINRKYTDHEIISVVCPGTLWLLSTRVAAYYEGLEDLTSFTAVPAETIIKELVSYNLAAEATVVNGRFREGTITGVTVETDSGAGYVLNWSCAGETILDSLEKAALLAGGDFDFYKTGDAAWDFRYYPGQLGSDRRTTVKFSLSLGNMKEPNYSFDRTDERTAAIVLGKGEGAARDTAVVTISPPVTTNDSEMVVNANDVELGETDKLNDRGSSELQRTVTRQIYNYNVLQTTGSYYGRDYNLGDLVTGELWFNGSTIDQKIVGVNVTHDNDGVEAITVDMQEVINYV